MPGRELGHLNSLLDCHYLIVTLDKSCHLSSLFLSSFKGRC